MNEIIEYQPLVDEIKELINKKQYQVLKLMNAETINLYWEIGEEIYRQQTVTLLVRKLTGIGARVFFCCQTKEDYI